MASGSCGSYVNSPYESYKVLIKHLFLNRRDLMKPINFDHYTMQIMMNSLIRKQINIWAWSSFVWKVERAVAIETEELRVGLTNGVVR